MTYIENVFICMASPLLIAALCMGRRQAKFFLCCLAGMGACLLSAYINTFFAFSIFSLFVFFLPAIFVFLLF